jgi:hypothetical protein
MPWSIETDVELETSQDRVADWPLLIEAGDAENELMANGLDAGVEGVVGALFLQYWKVSKARATHRKAPPFSLSINRAFRSSAS